jgi:hypothetical protein
MKKDAPLKPQGLKKTSDEKKGTAKNARSSKDLRRKRCTPKNVRG